MYTEAKEATTGFDIDRVVGYAHGYARYFLRVLEIDHWFDNIEHNADRKKPKSRPTIEQSIDFS